MEAIIARLLDAFEQGKMNRRQLVQSLAVAAGAQAVMPSTAQAASVPSPAIAPFKTAGLDHISYAVADYGKSRDFYAGLMGWEVRDDTGSEATMAIGETGSIILRKNRQPASPPGQAGRPQ
ncbi:MAG: hypothetical protein EXR93_12745, partial [Gemmatimonadetes bacterium]|nr:hypothetical protein [Gemmatimonadota bacterium]